MPLRTLLLVVVLIIPAGPARAAEAAEPAAPSEQAPSGDPAIAKIERRLQTNAARLAAQRARRETVAGTLTGAEEGLAGLAAKLKRLEELTAETAGRPAEATRSEIAEIDAINEALAPMQRKKREWTRTLNEGRSTLAAIDRAIAGLEAERGRIERELDRARTASGGLLAE